MVSSTTTLSLTTFIGSDTIDLVTHVSTGLAQKIEDIFTGAAYPAGNLTIDFNSASNRILTIKNNAAGTAGLVVDETGTFGGLLTANAGLASAGAFTITYGTGDNTITMKNTGGASGNAAIRWQGSGGTNQAGIASNFGTADAGNLEFLNGNTTNMRLSSAGVLTLANGGIAITGNSAFGTTVNTLIGLVISSAEIGGANNTAETMEINGNLTKSGTTGDLRGLNVTSSAITVNGAVTCDRATQLYAGGVTATVTGTLTNHNAGYFGTPVNGGTVRVIDSAAGGYLTTGGIWTNNPSFAALKRNITPVAPTEQAALLDWLRDEYKPIRYRYADAWIDEQDQDGKPVRQLTRYERDNVDYPHVGFLLDDMPQNIRELVCADVSGGISPADVGGFLLMLLKETARQLKVLQGKVN